MPCNAHTHVFYPTVFTPLPSEHRRYPRVVTACHFILFFILLTITRNVFCHANIFYVFFSKPYITPPVELSPSFAVLGGGASSHGKDFSGPCAKWAKKPKTVAEKKFACICGLCHRRGFCTLESPPNHLPGKLADDLSGNPCPGWVLCSRVFSNAFDQVVGQSFNYPEQLRLFSHITTNVHAQLSSQTLAPCFMYLDQDCRVCACV